MNKECKTNFVPIVKPIIDSFLTPRQQEILLLWVDGNSGIEIADKLNIAYQTVKNITYGIDNSIYEAAGARAANRSVRGVVGGFIAMSELNYRPNLSEIIINLENERIISDKKIEYNIIHEKRI